LFLDLGDMWKRLDLDKTYPANFQARRERDGKQYFLPVDYTWAAIYYNKSIFNRYNLKPPKTWDEFLGVCNTLQAEGIPPSPWAGRAIFRGNLVVRLPRPAPQWSAIPC